MAIKAKLGAGVWDMLICEDCSHMWTAPDVDLEWTDDPDNHSADECSACHSTRVIREERG